MKDPDIKSQVIILIGLAVVCLLFAIPVHALEFDIGIGQTKANHPNNGIWYQEEFEHSFDLKSVSYHAGIRFAATDNLDVIGGYKHLGDFSSNAQASASDPNYARYQAGLEDIWPLSTWKGENTVKGFYAGLEYSYKSFFVKAGGYQHKNKFSITVPDWRRRENGSYGEPQYLKKHADDSSKLGWFLGVGVKYGKFSLGYEILEVKGDKVMQPISMGRAHNVSIGYTF